MNASAANEEPRYAPAPEIFGVEREQHRKEVDEDVVAVVVGGSDGQFALVPALLPSVMRSQRKAFGTKTIRAQNPMK